MGTKCFNEGTVITSWAETNEVPPHCPRCHGLLRPDVVWFGEQLPHENLNRAVAAARHSDVFFSVGTSAIVQPAASLPLEAVQSDALTVEINPQPTPVSPYMDYVLPGPAGEVLPALAEAAWPTH